MEKLELTQEEKLILDNRRKATSIIKQCGIEVQEVLNKYNAVLVVDGNSPISNPSITIKLI